MKSAALILALSVSACAFSSAAPLISEREATYPFQDGAIYDWLESNDPSDATVLRFQHAAAGGYGVTEDAHSETPMPVVFLAVAATPEEDYILQVQLERGDSARAYAFAWRDGEGYRVLASPESLDEGAKPLVGADNFCSWRNYHECSLSSREDLMSLYHDVIYPRFVAGGEIPGSYATLLPHDAATPEPTRK